MRRAVALLITLFFIMLISISVGIGLKQVNEASAHVKGEKFLYQSSVILEDVISILNNAQELKDINSSEGLALFLSESSFIPFQAQGIQVSIELSSARAKFNVNSLVDENHKANTQRVASLKQYMSNYMVITTYVDILLDAMSGIKDDMSYNSDIFNTKVDLFRDYIASKKHLDELNEYYTSYYHEYSLKNIEFEKLFSYSTDKNYKIDLSFATPEVWELMIGCDKQRAVELSSNFYTSKDEIGLSKEEQKRLENFSTTLFEKFLEVSINISQDKHSANIKFEYDIQNAKGSNFVYEI